MWKITTITFCAALLTGAWGWGYEGDEGPDHWADDYGDCALNRQSPINIETMEAESLKELGMSPLEYHGYDSTNVELELVNNGHAAQVNIKNGDIKIMGGGLLEPYHLAQYHFHWGSNSRQGSEHTFNEVEYPMEMHLVHYAESFGSLGDAADRTRGLAVLGFFFEVGGSDNPDLDTIVNNLVHVHSGDDTYDIPAFSLDSLLPPRSANSVFYRYEGSLTTPGCYQSVVWTVFEDTIKISEAQLEAFRELMSEDGEHGHHIVDNFRPVQPLNQRVVYTNRPHDEEMPSGSAVPFASVVVLLMSAILAKLLC